MAGQSAVTHDDRQQDLLSGAQATDSQAGRKVGRQLRSLLHLEGRLDGRTAAAPRIAGTIPPSVMACLAAIFTALYQTDARMQPDSASSPQPDDGSE